MRMWQVNPEFMCNQHLLGEHLEMHMYVGQIKRRINLDGYAANNLLETKGIRKRHDALVAEMELRGMNHKSPLADYDLSYLPDRIINSTVDREASLAELLNRCDDCGHYYNSATNSDLLP